MALLASAPLAFVDYGSIAGATAGVGMVGPLLLGVVSAMLCLLGLAFGVVALARPVGVGRREAWAGVALNGLLPAAYAAVTAFALVGSDALRRWSP